MKSNDGTIKVKIKTRVNKMTKVYSIHLEFLHYDISHLPTIILQRIYSDDEQWQFHKCENKANKLNNMTKLLLTITL